jgi:hypothetical protein
MVQSVLSTTVVGLQGNPVSAVTPLANQALVWNGSAWAPTTVAQPNSPVFTGAPTVPSPALSTDNTQIATTAFIRTGVTDGSSPAVGSGEIGEFVQMSQNSQIDLPGSGSTALQAMALQPGVWLAWGGIQPQGAFVWTTCGIGTGPTNLNLSNQAFYFYNGEGNTYVTFANVIFGPVIINISVATTIYLTIALGQAGTAGNSAVGYADFYRIR